MIQGSLEVFAEAEVQAGQFKGYAKPIFDHLHIQRMKSQGWGATFKAWVYRRILQLLRNKEADRIATRIHFEGSFDDPQINTLAVIGNFLKNAFGSAFRAKLEHRFGDYFRKRPSEREIVYTYGKPRLGWWGFVKEAFSRWTVHEAPRMSASLSYYTCFSLAPLLLLMIALIGVVFGREASQGYVQRQLTGLVGSQSAETIQTMIAAAWKPTQGIFALCVSGITLLFGAFGVLSELKVGLNRVMKATETGGLGKIIKDRAKFLGLILGIGFLLLVSLGVSAALASLGTLLSHILPFPVWSLHLLELLVSISTITALFAMMFRFLPNRQLGWGAVGIGSFLTAVLFTGGKFILGFYLGKGSTASAYGAAGSVLILLLWVYYSAFILYFGAEFTMVYAENTHQAQSEKPT